MAIFEDEPKPTKSVHVIGSDLSLLSAEELGERIDALKAEIARLEDERERKKSSRSAADAFFR